MKVPAFLMLLRRQADRDREPDAAVAARAMARRRRQLEREPVKALARQICTELGRPVPPALQERR